MPRRIISVRSLPHLAVVAITLIALAAAIVWASLHRGPWYDEFYTQFATRPEAGWWQELTGSWLADNHPPFFYILMRMTTWLGDIEHHRLVNLLIAAVAIAGAWIVVRGDRRLRMAGLLLVLLLAANTWTLLTATELRSYFTSLCAGALLCLSLAAIWISPAESRRARAIVYAGTVLVAFNTHIITTLFTGALLVPFLVFALIKRDWQRLRALIPAPLAAGAVFAATTAVQISHWENNTQVFWIPAGFDAARYSIEYAAQRTLEANLPILLAAVLGGILVLRDIYRTRRIDGLSLVCVLLGAGMSLALTMLVGIHMIRPILIEKYLVAMVGTIAFLMAAMASRLLEAVPRRLEPWLLAIAVAASIIALFANMRIAADRYSWLGTGRLIAETVQACPGTTVHTDDYWNADVMAMSPADNRYISPWAYRQVASNLGFAIAPSASRSLSAECPNLFWAEHDTKHRFTEGAILEHIRSSGFAIGSLTLYRVGDGWVASDRPLRSRRPMK